MPIELIVKYYGDINAVANALSATVEILSPSIAIITIDPAQVWQLYNHSEIEYIEPPKIISLTSDESQAQACIPQAALAFGLTGRGTVTAFIDSGLDYTHTDFQNNDNTTRILYLWDMSKEGTPPQGFRDGHLYTEQELNAALASPSALAVIAQIDTIGHGTAVAGVAAGNGRSSGGEKKGAAPESAIIAVKLGRGGNVNNARTTELMRALKFVADKARELNKACAVNISFGTNEGAHDGNSLFESFVNEISVMPKMSVIVAAGNEGSAGHHFSGYLPTGASENIEFIVSGGLVGLYLVMWKSFDDEFSLEIISPDAKSSGVVRTVDKEKQTTLGGAMIYIDMGQPTHYNVEQDIFIEMSGDIMPGLWRLNLKSINTVVGSYHLWLPTTEEVTRGTAFSRPNVNATITMPATAAKVITVGAYDAKRNSIAEFSGRGFTDRAVPEKPDLTAPGVNVVSTKAGGGYDSYSGTSIAAPFVTGAAALLMEWGIVKGNDPGLYGERLKAYLRLGAGRDKNRKYPNEQWGHGTLCLNEALKYLISYNK